MTYTDNLGRKARCFSGADRDVTHSKGVIVGVADFPTYVVVTPSGDRVHWGCHITEVGPPASTEEYFAATALRPDPKLADYSDKQLLRELQRRAERRG